MSGEHTDAWAAGFFEGEGCIYVGRIGKVRIRHIVRCLITNTELSLLQIFETNYGGRIRTKKGTRLSRKPLWEWAVHAKTAAAFLTKILPYMNGKKKLNAIDALAICALMQPQLRGRDKSGRLALTSPALVGERDAIIVRMRRRTREG